MNLSPVAVQQFFDNNGEPLVGGQLFTYAAGTSDKIATYKNQSGSEENTNPIILDFRGEGSIWLDPELTYKYVLAPPGDTDPPTNPIWTRDNISAPDPGSGGVSGPRALGRFTGTLTSSVTEGVIGIDWSCGAPGVYQVNFALGLFSSPPIVTATPTRDGPDLVGCLIDPPTATEVVIYTRDATGTLVDNGVHFHAFEIVP